MSSSSNTSSNPKILCEICSKTIAKNHRFIHCQTCNAKVHIKCNNTDVKIYNMIKTGNLPQNCIKCQPQYNSLLPDDLQLSTVNNSDIIIPKSHCGICKKTIAKNHRNIDCLTCNSKVHIKCNQTDIKTYNKIINENLPQTCIKCKTEILPFQNLSDTQFSDEINIIHASTSINPKIQCGICTKTIAKNHRKIKCQSCNTQVHIKCNQTDVKTYKSIINGNLTEICFKCKTSNEPIQKTYQGHTAYHL